MVVPTLAERAALAVGEQNARLQGVVLEAGTGVPMPGAKVTVRSDAMIGGSKSATTDDDGRFDFCQFRTAATTSPSSMKVCSR